MFCGDETGAFVGEVGWSNSRFGWGGGADPQLQVPSIVTSSKNIGLSALNSSPAPTINPISSNAMNSSEITDWDAWEVMWSKAMEMSHCSDRPILSTDQGFSPDGQKAKMTEVMFEKFQVPAFFIGHTAALSAFSLGRHTALVVDCGGGGCTATPVIDGMILKNSLKRSLRGGDFLDGRIKELLEEKTGKALSLRSELMGPNGKYRDATKSYLDKLSASAKVYRDFCMHSAMTDFKKQHGNTLQYAKVDMREVSGLIPPDSVYELPDGTPVNVNDHPDLYVVPEAMFAEGSVATIPSSSEMETDEGTGAGGDDQQVASTSLRDVPLHRLAHQALSDTDVDARKELLMNLVLSGAGSRFQGLDTRLNKELTAMTPSAYRVKVLSGKKGERMNAAWIGGSILTSLGSFQQLWLSKAEYEEYGSTLAVQRFP